MSWVGEGVRGSGCSGWSGGDRKVTERDSLSKWLGWGGSKRVDRQEQMG